MSAVVTTQHRMLITAELFGMHDMSIGTLTFMSLTDYTHAMQPLQRAGWTMETTRPCPTADWLDELDPFVRSRWEAGADDAPIIPFDARCSVCDPAIPPHMRPTH